MLRPGEIRLLRNLPPQTRYLMFMLGIGDNYEEFMQELDDCPWGELAAALEHCVELEELEMCFSGASSSSWVDVKDLNLKEVVLPRLPDRLRSISSCIVLED